MVQNNAQEKERSWQSVILNYSQPRISRSVWQMINSLGPYLLLWVIIVQVAKISPWLTIPFILLASGFLVRIFIIFHDCGHGSFFKSKKANVIVGKIFGILALTPYHKWTDSHQRHHQTVGDLDKRGDGDVWTMTVDEYLESSPRKRFFYRMFRDPAFLFLFAGPLSFLVYSRFTRKSFTKKQKQNVWFTNIVLLLLATGVSLLIGWKMFLLIQVPVMYFAGMAGIYLFYFQHQYEEVKWARTKDWDYKDMALHGSSFFKLPVLLRWFSGNIGFHHIHHLGPRIPNYNLVKCHEENPMFQEVDSISLFQSFHSLKLRLWDEENERIISFRELRRAVRQPVA
jgi:omega-6 fatty acid desaturase (delta-12 desaturase)